MEPRYLETALQRLEADGELAFFSSSQSIIDGNGDPQPEMTEQYAAFQGRDRFPDARMDNTLEPLLEFGLFSISGAVFRHASVAPHGLVDPDLGGIYPFEFNVFLRIAERGLPAWYTPERLVAYRWHSASMRQSDGSILTRYMVETLVEVLRRRRFGGACWPTTCATSVASRSSPVSGRRRCAPSCKHCACSRRHAACGPSPPPRWWHPGGCEGGSAPGST
jgi:hypothetical protein